MATERHPLAVVLASGGRRKNWLAEQLGIHPTMLSHYLARRRVPPEDFYIRAAALLEISVEDITPQAPVAA